MIKNPRKRYVKKKDDKPTSTDDEADIKDTCRKVLTKLFSKKIDIEKIISESFEEDLDTPTRKMFEEYLQSLFPAAARVYNIDRKKLKRSIIGPKIRIEPHINAQVELAGENRFLITIYPPLIELIYQMAKLFSTRIKFLNEGLHGTIYDVHYVEDDSEISFDETANYAVELMSAFYSNTIFDKDIIETLKLNQGQILFAGFLTRQLSVFITAHELGHIINFIAPTRTAETLDLMTERVRDFVNHGFLNDFPRGFSIMNWEENDFIKNWGAELTADHIGMTLALADSTLEIPSKAFGVRSADLGVFTCWAIETLLIFYDMLERFSQRSSGHIYMLDTHPFSWMRLSFWRMDFNMDDVFEKAGIPKVGKNFGDLADNIMKNIGLPRSPLI
jgi:hypothetical protein